MSSKGVLVKVKYHKVGQFYTVRGKRISDIESLRKMQSRIMSVTNAKWKWRVVLTFNPKSLRCWYGKYGTVGRALTVYVKKLRSKFWGFKCFWKYEEGTKVFCKGCNKKVGFSCDKKREGWVFCNVCKSVIKGGDIVRYHLLFDFVNRTTICKKDDLEKRFEKIRSYGGKVVRKTELVVKGVDKVEIDFVVKRFEELDLKKLIHPKAWDKINWKRWMMQQRGYEVNEKKTDIEILLGYYMFKKWGNGITLVREVMGYVDLKSYVKKDFYKYTEAKYLKKDAKKWYYSLNLAFDPKGEVQAEWERVLETVGMFPVDEALYMVMESKEAMVDYYNSLGKVGAYVYKRVINDIESRMVDEEGLLKKGVFLVDYLAQKRLGEKYGK